MLLFLFLFYLLQIQFQCLLSFQFLHITDIHLDLSYLPASADNCMLRFTGMSCCHSFQISKSPYNIVDKWGSYTCDTPIDLLNSTFEELRHIVPPEQLDFIINTGDNADHHIITQNFRKNIQANRIVQQIISLWYPEVPIINVIGNHDTFPIDQTIPLYENFIYKSLDSIWKTNSTTFTSGGFYLYERNYICMFVVNSLYFDSNNFRYRIFNNTDFNQQFHWLDKTMQLCTEKNKKIWILNHEPPSSGFYKQEYFNILNKFKHSIIHQFFGHTHRDHFLVFYNQNNPIGSGFIAPSFLPDNHDPNFRLYSYNGTHIDNYNQYHVNLMKTRMFNKSIIEKSYSFKDTYDISPTTQSFSHLLKNMQTNNTLFYHYCKHYIGHELQHCNKHKLLSKSITSL